MNFQMLVLEEGSKGKGCLPPPWKILEYVWVIRYNFTQHIGQMVKENYWKTLTYFTDGGIKFRVVLLELKGAAEAYFCPTTYLTFSPSYAYDLKIIDL